MQLELMNGPTSPFGRMTKVVALELEIGFEDRVIDVYGAEFLDQWNPLRQIPTLIVDDKFAIYDSRNICAYFNALAEKPSIFPPDDWRHDTRVALATGIMEAGLQRRMEIVRPAGERSQSFIDKMETRIDRCLDHMEEMAGTIGAGSLRMDQIAAACALEYTDFRFSDSWRKRCPSLAAWLESFARRPSMAASRPKE